MTAGSGATSAPGVPRWMGLASLVLALGGVVASAYLTYEHFSGSTSLACPDTGRINCAKVTSSSYSVVAGVPIAPIGLGFFCVLALLCLPWAWRSTSTAVRAARGLLVIGGLGFALYLVHAELFRVHAICLWCTGVHLLTLALFLLVLFAEAWREDTVGGRR